MIAGADPMQIAIDTPPTQSEAAFLTALLAQMFVPLEVLELGTLRSDPALPTHHRDWLGVAAIYRGADVVAGPDVDLVLDAHDMSCLPDGSIDVLIAVAVLEHLARPWVAMKEMARVLRPGGLLYVETHHTFPLHGYPNDYWRFSREALRLLMTDAGLHVVSSSYRHACTIQPPPEVANFRWNPAAESYLNVDAFAVRAV